MSQQDNSRAAVERLLAELAATDDPNHATALTGQIRLHAELAGLAVEDLAKLIEQATAPAAKPAKPVKPTGD